MNPEKAREVFTIGATALEWMAMHGNVCLGLRHPSNQGPSRELAIHVRDLIAAHLVRCGMMSQAEIDQCHRDEDDARRRYRS